MTFLMASWRVLRSTSWFVGTFLNMLGKSWSISSSLSWASKYTLMGVGTIRDHLDLEVPNGPLRGLSQVLIDHGIL